MTGATRSWRCIGVAMLAAGLAGPAIATSSTGNILYIGEGGVAFPDSGEGKRHWSEWTINLIDGSDAYGWTSAPGISLPHDVTFELAGVGSIRTVTLDTTFSPVTREDGSRSEKPDGAPLKSFTLLGSLGGREGPYVKILDAEAAQNTRSTFTLPTAARARWLRLVLRSNWGGAPRTRLSEIEAIGTLESRVTPSAADISGFYRHEYGTIILRQDGTGVVGCYDDGKGQLSGLASGRVLRLVYLEPQTGSLGTAVFSWSGNQLYGFWYRPTDQMGSPWNAPKVSALADKDPGKCRKYLYPQRADR